VEEAIWLVKPPAMTGLSHCRSQLLASDDLLLNRRNRKVAGPRLVNVAIPRCLLDRAEVLVRLRLHLPSRRNLARLVGDGFCGQLGRQLLRLCRRHCLPLEGRTCARGLFCGLVESFVMLGGVRTQSDLHTADLIAH
jgi:hypothetical protein